MEEQLLPVDAFTDTLSDVFGAVTATDLACQVIAAQPGVELAGTANLGPTQELMRAYALHWTSEFRADLRNAFTWVKAFASRCAELTENEIDALLESLDASEGKQDFSQAIQRFMEEAGKGAAKTQEVGDRLTAFATGLDTDLYNFQTVRKDAVATHGDQDGKLTSLVQEMQARAHGRSELAEVAAAFAARSGTEVAALTETVTADATVRLVKARLTVTSATDGSLGRVLKETADQDAEYTRLFEEATALAVQPAVLQWFADSYAALGRPRETVLAGLMSAWNTTADNFEAIGEAAKGSVDQEVKLSIKTLLVQASADGKKLKAVADKLDSRSASEVGPAS
ncbi:MULTISPECIES: hypothetical protein [unclassified Streptomyces]|uniref:hypothetical protein n=1 Tax=unclassified Streptomyces TaxID=2593676 RepID=UPI0035DB0FA4